jgi:uncharacterized protein YbaP (TraB family)
MMRRLAGLMLGLVAWCGAQPAPLIKEDATPALWQVQGVHGTVYLYGSVHVMKPDVVWETARVKDALKASDVLYLEIADLDPASAQAMQPMVAQLGMDAEHPLSTKISKADVDLLDAAVKKLGLPGESSFEPMKPWLVYLTLSVLPAVQAGYEPGSGIDQKILAEAQSENKPVKGFETASEQLHYLADFPQAQQVELLHQTLVDLPKSTARVDEMVDDWTRGDVDKIAAVENDEMKVKYPALYAKLLVSRNEHFAGVLDALLKDPATGTVFVTIGAAHLAGPDSVLKMLEKKGFSARRVE